MEQPDHRPHSGLLDGIRTPADVKALNPDQLPQLAREIRERIIAVTSKNGGHVGPNLGVVELTIALHRIFNSPRDPFLFDVSHQGYVHKLLTGRNGPGFDNLRRSGGLSGFLYRKESPHDAWGAGHAGTALSAALGMASARDLKKGNEHVIAVIGDAALTCGITMEALNNIVSTTRRLVVVLNDNEWSIAKNVGAIAGYLNELITNPVYNRLHHDLESFLKKVPGGGSLIEFGSLTRKNAKNMLVPSCIFEKYGLRYLGPVDGHDFEMLHRYLEFTKKSEEPVLLHVLTKKGKGYDVAIEHPEKFHGTSPFEISTGKSLKKTGPTPPNYQDVFGAAMVRFAKENPAVVGITAAMPSGTGLSALEQEMPDRFFDVGIAEEHAVLFAGGMAARGHHPVCGIYSTFLQRAYDPIIHDICLQNLPVTFALDRGGLSPNDGPTHHGLFDLAYLRCIPNSIVMQPKDENELVDMLYTCVSTPSPTFIRYPRGAGEGVPIKENPDRLKIGKAEQIRKGSDVCLWALGPMVNTALKLANGLEQEGYSVSVVNARFVKPLDTDLLRRLASDCGLLVTLEDHVLMGGMGSAVLEALQDMQVSAPVERIGWPDTFVEHGSSVGELRARYGLNDEDISERILSRLQVTADVTGGSLRNPSTF